MANKVETLFWRRALPQCTDTPHSARVSALQAARSAVVEIRCSIPQQPMSCCYVRSAVTPACQLASLVCFAMDKADRKKRYDRSVPELSFNKDLKQSYESSLESVEEHEDRETTLETCSNASMPPNKDHIRELSILHHLIVERSDTHSCKCSKHVNKQ